MSSSFHSDNLQGLTLQAFTVLSTLRPALDGPTWSGALILNVGLDATGCALSLAANIAGAVSLTLEPDPTLLRAALRAGACDFVVNTLDEAVRVMKNEVRRRRPLSVGLETDPSSALDEIVARGLVPELFTAPAAYPAPAAHFRSLGALIVSFVNPDEPNPTASPETPTSAALLASFLATHPWQLRTFTLSTLAALCVFDTRALTLLQPEDPPDQLRRQWLLVAPRIFPRDRHRTLWFTPEETRTFETPPT